MLLRRFQTLTIFFWLLLSFFPLFVSAQTTNNLSLTATVAAQASDYYTLLEQTTSGSQFAQDSTIAYKITYGTHLSSLQSFTLQASWSRGTFADPGVPAVDVLDYVTSSASKAYNSSTAIVDLVNRTITWTISDFPAATVDQTVNFSLKTTSQYTGSSQVNFTVSAQILGAGINSSISSINGTYLYNPPPTPTPVPTTATSTNTTSGPTATPGPGPTVTPTPTISKRPGIQNVSVSSIGPDQIILSITTDQKTKLIVKYGLTVNNLNQTIINLHYAASQSLIFDNLNPATNYYFQITSASENQVSSISDIYVVQTAAVSEKPEVDQNSLLSISSNIVLYSNNDNTGQNTYPVVVIPTTTDYIFQFALKNNIRVKEIKIFLRNKTILAAATSDQLASDTSTDVVEIRPGIFDGRLKSPSNPGYYELFCRIYDTNGNISETKMSELKVTDYLTVYNKVTNEPVDKAKIIYYLFDLRLNKYILLSPQIYAIENPTYTNLYGQVASLLAIGKYQVEVTAIGYKKQVVPFTLGAGANESYPKISLIPEPFNLVNGIEYYLNSFADFAIITRSYLVDVSNSRSLFEFTGILIMFTLVSLTLISLSARIRIPLSSFWHYYLHHGRVQEINHHTGQIIKGQIYDEKSGQALNRADVFLIDADNDKVVDHYHVIRNFQFYLYTIPQKKYLIEVLKDGYEHTFFDETQLNYNQAKEYNLKITKSNVRINIANQMQILLRQFMALLFETLLIISIIFEIAFGFTFGWSKIMIFIIVSLLNILFWLIHLTHLRSAKTLAGQ